ncbi:MAG TPA: GGDEF domain-containing protein [Pelomicrobium sp.]|nr:GGDEF domain-containing protein [Pelomicrobium sp.]
MSQSKSLPSAIALVSAIVLGIVIVASGTRLAETEWNRGDLASETLFVAMVFVWIAITSRLTLRPRTAWLLQGGLLLVLLGGVADALDEIYEVPGILSGTFENVGFPAGMLMVTVSLYWLVQDYARTLASLRGEKELFEARSVSDAQTTLLNRRAFDEALSTQMAVAGQNRRPLSLLVLDLDNFKQFNDTYGHPEGDKVIAAAGQVIRRCIRATDVGCRYGGEEFAVILPEAGHDEAMRVAERIRKEFALTVFEPRPGEKVSKTLSVGLASLQPNDSPEGLFDRADGALYAAKRMGKDRSLYG